MGNKYSTEENKEISNPPNYLAEFYGKEEENPEQIGIDYQQRAEEVTRQIENYPENIIIKKRIDIFVDPEKGLRMPYESSEFRPQLSDELVISDDPKYIEFIICKGDLSEFSEKYAVHHKTPTHDCGANCRCIQKMVKVMPSSQHKRVSRSFDVSPTSSNPVPRTIMTGGADVETSDDIPSPPEKEDDLFSESSEKMSTTDTSSPGKGKQKKKKSKEEEEEEVKLGEEEEDEPLVDEPDEPDEDLAGIDNEEEGVEEDGFLLSQSDITSSELYRMQSRIFGSETTDHFASENFTEEVRKAMDKADRRKNLYNSSEREVMMLSSPSKKVMNKPIKRNMKYT